MDATKTFTITQTATQLGVSAHTLRYYEREGLLGAKVRRNASGHREYNEQDLLWFRLLLCLRQTGMPIEQVKAFAEMGRQGAVTIAERHALLLNHQATLADHIATMQKMLTMLKTKVASYEKLLEDSQTSDTPRHRSAS